MGRGGTHLPDGWTRSPGPGVNRTGTPISHPTGECRSRSKPAGHSKDNPERVSAGSRARPAPETDQPYAEAEGDSPHETVSAPKPILPAGYAWVAKRFLGLADARYAL
jgi:hypothetical protein